MGGFGSGAWYRLHKRECVDDHIAVDVRHWKREGLIRPGRWFTVSWSSDGEVRHKIQMQVGDETVTLHYRQRVNGGDWRNVTQTIRLTYTSCHLGGRRPWFLCPTDGCGRRVAILYIGDAGIFACRHCNRLAYACQSELPDERAARRADRIRRRLGWPVGISNPNGGKARGMHRRTFNRLKSEHDEFVRASLIGTAMRLGLLQDRLGCPWESPSDDD